MVVLVLPNVITEPSDVSKNKGTSECNKKLVLPNVKLVSFNVSKKNKGIMEYDKSTIIRDVGIA